MSVILRVECSSNGLPTPFDGLYVKEYDPERDGIAPGGRLMVCHLVCTDNPSDALEFDSVSDAIAMWRRVCLREPTRPDGKPNRPLTHFSVSVLHKDRMGG